MKVQLNRLISYFRENDKRYIVVYKWLIAVILAFTVYYLFTITVRPVLNYEYIFPEEKGKKTGGFSHDFNSYYFLNDSIIDKSIQLAHNEASLLASLEMAKDDTIALLLDLSDSTVSLVIQGVSIFESHITGFKYSKIFNKSDPFLTTKYFSWPFKIEDYTSSVTKVPVIVRKAPKDTIEAASLPEPEVLEENSQYVSFLLKLDRKLNLVFEQDSISQTIEKKSIRNYLHQQKKTKKKAIRNALITGGTYQYLPEIRIKLNRSDALVIFRAIPENADIAIRLNPNEL